MKKVKRKEVYIYDYPENREIAKGLMRGDYEKIAYMTGYSKSYVYQIFQGKRRMTDEIRSVAKEFIKENSKVVAKAAAL